MQRSKNAGMLSKFCVLVLGKGSAVVKLAGELAACIVASICQPLRALLA